MRSHALELAKEQRFACRLKDNDEMEFFVVQGEYDDLRTSIITTFYPEMYDGHFRPTSQGYFNLYVDDEEFMSYVTDLKYVNKCVCSIQSCNAYILFCWIGYSLRFRRFPHSIECAHSHNNSEVKEYNDVIDMKSAELKSNPIQRMLKNELNNETFTLLPDECKLSNPNRMKDPATEFCFNPQGRCLNYAYRCEARMYKREKENGDLFVFVKGTHNHALFNCDQCEERFDLKTELKSHVVLKHATAPLFDCDECEKSFISKQHLNFHKKTHEKPFKCDECGHQFTQKPRLKTHKKNFHEGQFPCHNCTEQGYSFETKEKLYSHLSVEHDEQPYQCDMGLCDFSSGRKSRFLQHYRDVHKIDASSTWANIT